MLKRIEQNQFAVRFAKNAAEIKAAQRLRYRVFVEEFGAPAKSADHHEHLEADEFDARAAHLCLIDQKREENDPENAVIGVYRLLCEKNAEKLGAYYTESEFNIDPILALDGRKMEIGRSCIDPQYRGGLGSMMLWSELARFIKEENINVLFGAASYHGTDFKNKTQSLSYLHQNYLAPASMRAQTKDQNQPKFLQSPEITIDKLQAMKQTPSLIKTYLRLGGKIGEGVFLDQDFNTIDVFVILKTEPLRAMARAH